MQEFKLKGIHVYIISGDHCVPYEVLNLTIILICSRPRSIAGHICNLSTSGQ